MSARALDRLRALEVPSLRSPAGGRRVPSFTYQPGLDGLRAVSVIAVLLYHGGISWMPGGFLGVEVFLVISGYLITTLLLEEQRKTGTIAMRQFWVRRARRLLPALFLVLVATTAWFAVFLQDEVAKLRGDLVAALTYVTNWYLIFSEQSYFDQTGRPSPFRHLWSLAVEEQWYLLWPVVFFLMLRFAKGRAHRLFWPIAALAGASTLWMLVLYDPTTDPSRVYYGTDTRAAALLIGAAVACVWHPWRRPAAARRPNPLADAVGLAALGVLVLFLALADEYGTFLYRGGFAVVSLVSIVVIALVVDPSAVVLRRVLGAGPLVWLGLRSYGLYLWHWPVFMVLRPQDTGLDGWALLAVRLAVTMVLTEVSFRFVETPIRKEGLSPVRRLYARLAGGRRGAGALASVPLLTVALLGGLLVVRVGTAERVDPFAGDGDASIELTAGAAGAATTVATPATTAAAPGTTGAAPATTAPTTAPARGRPPRVTVVGDSVGIMLVRNAPPEAKQTFSLKNGAIEGCGIVDGVMSSSRGQRRSFEGCRGWPERWAANVTAGQAEVALVSIGAWDVFDLDQDGTELAFGTPAYDDYLRGQLQLGIDALKGAGVKVALLEVPCYRPVDGGGLKALPERGEDARTQRLNVVLREAAAADPQHVTFVEGPDAYCTDEALATDLGHRWDGVHYYKPGAQLVWDTITPQLSGL